MAAHGTSALLCWVNSWLWLHGKSCNECGSTTKSVDALFLHIGKVHRKVNEILEKRDLTVLKMPVLRIRKSMWVVLFDNKLEGTKVGASQSNKSWIKAKNPGSTIQLRCSICRSFLAEAVGVPVGWRSGGFCFLGSMLPQYGFVCQFVCQSKKNFRPLLSKVWNLVCWLFSQI